MPMPMITPSTMKPNFCFHIPLTEKNFSSMSYSDKIFLCRGHCCHGCDAALAIDEKRVWGPNVIPEAVVNQFGLSAIFGRVPLEPKSNVKDVYRNNLEGL